jgi:hypothetical protein
MKELWTNFCVGRHDEDMGVQTVRGPEGLQKPHSTLLLREFLPRQTVAERQHVGMRSRIYAGDWRPVEIAQRLLEMCVNGIGQFDGDVRNGHGTQISLGQGF